MSIVGIVADDLTGANDAAAQFASAGWPQVSSQFDLEAASSAPPLSSLGASAAGGRVIALCTGARALDDARARAVTAAATRRLIATGARRVFVKIDSTMRGSVTAQIAGALAAWRSAHGQAMAVLCPAHPAFGRTVSSGRLLVDGQDAASTEYARELRAPSAHMAALAPGAVCVPSPAASQAGAVDDLVAQLDMLRAGGTPAVAVDASSVDALRVIAAAIARLGSRVLPVGSGGLGAALADVWPAPALVGRGGGPIGRVLAGRSPGARVIVVATSRSQVARAQLTRLRDSYEHAGPIWIEPGTADLLATGVIARWRVQAAATCSNSLVILSVAVGQGPSKAGEGWRVAERLGELAAVALDCGQTRMLVTVGGDGTAAVLRAIDARGVRIVGWARAGVPFGALEGGRHAGLTVATKAGGFGDPDTLADVVRAVRCGLSEEAR